MSLGDVRLSSRLNHAIIIPIPISIPIPIQFIIHPLVFYACLHSARFHSFYLLKPISVCLSSSLLSSLSFSVSIRKSPLPFYLLVTFLHPCYFSGRAMLTSKQAWDQLHSEPISVCATHFRTNRYFRLSFIKMTIYAYLPSNIILLEETAPVDKMEKPIEVLVDQDSIPESKLSRHFFYFVFPSA